MRLLAGKREGGVAGFPSKNWKTLYLHPPLTKRGWPIFELSSTLFGKKDFHGENHIRFSGKAGEVEEVK